MIDRYKKSAEYLERALKVTPGGAQTLSKRAGRFPEGAYPVALDFGVGPNVIDIDGNRYLDMICGLACMTLGYGRSEIDTAVTNQLRRGVSFSLATTLEADVAEKICAMIPCAEMVRFTKTGSESTEAAIRIARKATGRDLILTIAEGYHSWHSWFQAVKPEHPGIPFQYENMVHTFAYNDLNALTTLARMCDVATYRVAAVILEACHYEQPVPGFLEGIRDLCTKYGIVLIFDEMVTGFRWANGGAQEYFGVKPDLACFGKACANGFPLSFVCGKREIMEHADVVSGTFGGEALSLAACNAVLDIYRDEQIIETLWARGKQFQDGFNDMRKVLDMEHLVACDGFAVKPRITFIANTEEYGIAVNTLAMSLFLQEIALGGILWHAAGGNVSAAMTKGDIENALFKMSVALDDVRRAIESGNWDALKGKCIASTPFVRKA